MNIYVLVLQIHTSHTHTYTEQTTLGPFAIQKLREHSSGQGSAFEQTAVVCKRISLNQVPADGLDYGQSLTVIQYIIKYYNPPIHKGTQSLQFTQSIVCTHNIHLSCYCTLGTATYLCIINYRRGAHHYELL